MHLRSQFWWLFWMICVVIAALLLPRVWSLRDLFTDPALRNQVRATIEHVADREGWLISDMPLQAIDHDGMAILHREHVRGADPVACYRITFSNAALTSCTP